MGDLGQGKKAKKTSSRGPDPLPKHLANSGIHKQYKLGRVLSRDPAGVLYAAEKKLNDLPVAVNVLNEGFTIVSRELIKIKHPNICTAHKVLKGSDGTIAIVFQAPVGKTLTELTDEGFRFTISQTISAILQLLSAIHAIHETGETACHLNANNIFLYEDENSNLKLNLANCGIGAPGTSLKAPHYLSPERIMDGNDGDIRSDIWATGAILYHLLRGRIMVDGKDAYEIASKNLLFEPKFDSSETDIPEGLRAILTRALDRDINERYQEVSQMVGDLLPLRAKYNEPMSEDVGRALRNSYPPQAQESSPKKESAPREKQQAKTVESSKKPRKDQTSPYSTSKIVAKHSVDISEPIKTSTEAKKGAKPPPIDAARKKAAKPVKQAIPKETPKTPPMTPFTDTNPNRTLLGIPPIVQTSEKKLAPEKPEKKPPLVAKKDDEKIKKREQQFDDLDKDDEEEVPTEVLSQDKLSLLVNRINELDESARGEPADSHDGPPSDVQESQPKDDKARQAKGAKKTAPKQKKEREEKAKTKKEAAKGAAPKPKTSPKSPKKLPKERIGKKLTSPTQKPAKDVASKSKPEKKIKATKKAGSVQALKQKAKKKEKDVITEAEAKTTNEIASEKESAPKSPPPMPRKEADEKKKEDIASPSKDKRTSPAKNKAGIDFFGETIGAGSPPPFLDIKTSSEVEPPPEKPADIVNIDDVESEIEISLEDSSDAAIEEVTPSKEKDAVTQVAASKGLTKRHKIIGATVLGVVVGVVILVIAVFSGEEPPSTATATAPPPTLSDPSPKPPFEKKKTASSKTEKQPQVPQKDESRVQNNTAKKAEKIEEPLSAPPVPSATTVPIHLLGAPDKGIVKVDGQQVEMPLHLPKSSDVVTVTIDIEGYKRWRRKVVPDRERTLPVRMTKTKSKQKKNKPKGAKSKDGLVSNPFKK